MSAMTTLAPLSRNASTNPRPTPAAPPVTTTTRSRSSRIVDVILHTHGVRGIDPREVGCAALGERGERLHVRRAAEQPAERLVLTVSRREERVPSPRHERSLRLHEGRDRLARE